MTTAGRQLLGALEQSRWGPRQSGGPPPNDRFAMIGRFQLLYPLP